jgi:thiamine-phosphate pyrophosphorylase
VPTTSLYLDLVIDDRARAMSALAAAIGAAEIASVLIRTSDGGSLEPNSARDFIAFAQAKDIAVLLTPETGNAAKLGADGVHFPWAENIVVEFKAARQTAKSGAIVAADAGRSRHDAMELGEAGADYIAFGIPPHVDDREKAAERQLGLIRWWAELFELPCVAFDVPDERAAHELAVAGADFIAVSIRTSDSEKDIADRLRSFSESIRVPEPAK